MIQDILPAYFTNQYQKKAPGAGSRIVAFEENRIYIKTKGEADFLPYEALEGWCNKSSRGLPETVFLFAIGDTDYFLAKLPEKFVSSAEQKEQHFGEGMAEYAFIPMFQVRRRTPMTAVLAASTAWHLYVWYRDNRYCGRCGKKLFHSPKLRMLSCPECGNEVFPKIAPAVIVGVTDGERILMTKYANREYKRYALIAGFTEIGETAEETVAREVMEEVGLAVKNIRYYKSQPWGFDSNLLLGYFCELDDSGEISLDEEELAEAEWVHYRDIPEDEEKISLTREMMTVFRDRFCQGG